MVDRSKGGRPIKGKLIKGESAADRKQRMHATAKANRRASERDIGPTPKVKNPARKSKLKFDLLGFLKGYLGHRYPLPFSSDHLDLIKSIQGIILHGGQRALAMPRGSGKTTILEGAMLWAQLYGHRRYLVIIAATGGKALEIMENLQHALAHNDELLDDFPEACHAVRKLGGVSQRTIGQTTEGLPTMLVWKSKEVKLPFTAAGGGSIIQITGITGAIRGAKVTLANGEDIRPDLCLIDDFQTRESAKSINQTDNRLQILRSDVLGLAGPGQAVACFCACTIIYRGDGAAQLLDRKNNPEWQGTTARMMVSMPSKKALIDWEKYTNIYHEDLGNDALPQEKKLFRCTKFYRDNRKAMDDGALAAWAERKLPGELSAIQHAMNLLITRKEEAFYAEYQNDPRGLEASEQPQLNPEQIVTRLNHIKPGIVSSSSTELVAFIDVGEGCLWWGLGAFSDGFRCDIPSYGAYPDPGRRMFSKREMEGALTRAHPTGSMEATWWAALTELCKKLLDEDHPDEQGNGRRVSLCLIDAGDGDATDTIFDFCKRSEWKDRLHPSRGKGIGAKTRPMADWPKEVGEKIGTDWRLRRNKARKHKEVLIGTNFWKSCVAARLKAPMGGPGCLTFAGDNPAAHELIAHHLCAERQQRVSTTERSVFEWTLKPGHDNDLLDVAVGLHVAASIRGISFAGVAPKEAVRKRGAGKSFADRQREAREKQAG
jgi:hypothetical protein